MATTKDAMTGINGTKTDFPFTFPYIKTTDLRVELFDSSGGRKELDSTKFTYANATTVSLSAIDPATSWQETTGAPKSGVTGNVYRATDDSNLAATFYPGSAIRSSDLNNNYTQNLYSTQENTNNAKEALDNSRVLESGSYVSAITKATNAVATADAADAIADGAKESADDAIAATNALVATNSGTDSEPVWVLQGDGSNSTTNNKGVKYAVEKADNAVSTAGDADTNATTALNNSRITTGGTPAGPSDGYTSAIYLADQAKTTADDADADATAAKLATDTYVAIGSTLKGDGIGSNPKGVAYAVTTAESAQSAVASSGLYTVVTNFAALPALTDSSLDADNPNSLLYQVSDSTDIEDESTVNGEPVGFQGASALAVKLKANITSSPKVWEWQEYFATDPETRYRKKLIVENLTTINEDYEIGNANNAMSVGPVTISSGKTITIPANSLYAVL